MKNHTFHYLNETLGRSKKDCVFMLIFVVLCCLNTCSSLPTKSSFALLNKILIQIRNGSTDLDKSLLKVNEYLNEIDRDQSNHERIYLQMKKECSEEINFRQINFSASQSKIKENQYYQLKCEENYKSTNEMLGIVKSDLVVENSNFKEITKIEGSKEKLYKDLVSEHQTILELISNLKLALKGNKWDKINSLSTSLLLMSAKFNFVSSITPIISTISNKIALLSTKNGEQNLLDLSNNDSLKENIYSTLKKENFANNLFILVDTLETKVKQAAGELNKKHIYSLQRFTSLKNLINSDKMLVEKESLTLNSRLDKFSDCRAEGEKVMKENLEVEVRHKELYGKAKTMCQSFKQEYESSTKMRNQEKKVLERIKLIIRRHNEKLKANH